MNWWARGVVRSTASPEPDDPDPTRMNDSCRRVVKREHRRSGPPGAIPERPGRAKHGRGGKPEPLRQETIGDRLSIGEVAHSNQRDAQPVAADLLQLLDPKITSDPEFIAGNGGALRGGRCDLDADGGQLFTPGGIDFAGTRARAAEQFLDRMVVQGDGPGLERRGQVGRPGRHQPEHRVGRGVTEPWQRGGRVAAEHSTADPVCMIGQGQQVLGRGPTWPFDIGLQSSIGLLGRRGRGGRLRDESWGACTENRETSEGAILDLRGPAT